jgi:DUF1680 family protein
MTPRLIEANPFVEETRNQVAIQRGPLVYCLESPDLPSTSHSSLRDILIPSNLALIARFDRNLLNGIVVLDGNAVSLHNVNWNGELYREFQPPAAQSIDVRFIPYFAWANRAPSEMTVWLPLSRQ